MKYMMFIKHAENYRMEEVPQALFAAMGTFVEESMKSGAILDTAGLQPTSKGKRIRLTKGKLEACTTARSPSRKRSSAATRSANSPRTKTR